MIITGLVTVQQQNCFHYYCQSVLTVTLRLDGDSPTAVIIFPLPQFIFFVRLCGNHQ